VNAATKNGASPDGKQMAPALGGQAQPAAPAPVQGAKPQATRGVFGSALSGPGGVPPEQPQAAPSMRDIVTGDHKKAPAPAEAPKSQNQKNSMDSAMMTDAEKLASVVTGAKVNVKKMDNQPKSDVALLSGMVGSVSVVNPENEKKKGRNADREDRNDRNDRDRNDRDRNGRSRKEKDEDAAGQQRESKKRGAKEEKPRSSVDTQAVDKAAAKGPRVKVLSLEAWFGSQAVKDALKVKTLSNPKEDKITVGDLGNVMTEGTYSTAVKSYPIVVFRADRTGHAYAFTKDTIEFV